MVFGICLLWFKVCLCWWSYDVCSFLLRACFVMILVGVLYGSFRGFLFCGFTWNDWFILLVGFVFNSFGLVCLIMC